jgi:hypothetical protein
MTLRDFIKKNHVEIDAIINAEVKNSGVIINNEERRLWVLNNVQLYNWARAEGVKI